MASCLHKVATKTPTKPSLDQVNDGTEISIGNFALPFILSFSPQTAHCKPRNNSKNTKNDKTKS